MKGETSASREAGRAAGGGAAEGVEVALRLRSGVVFLAFTGFGLLWGLYAAALPEIKARSGASDAQFGVALLCVALAAAPAMFVVGRLLDRVGRPVAVSAVVGFAVVAPLPAMVGSTPALVGALLLFGFGSGACDVVINSLAATVEAESGVRVMNRAHALFSVGLLVGSVLTGGARAAGLPAWALLALLAGLVAAGALSVGTRVPRRLARAGSERGGRRHGVDRVVLGFGLLAALALLLESGVQQWSAVFLEDTVGAPVWLSGLAPGVFAGSMALGRFGGHWITTQISDRFLLFLSGAVSAVGVLLVAAAEQPGLALAGFALAGAAISVSAPTIYGMAGRRADPQRRGATIGLTAVVAYAGLLLGPVVVGQLAAVTQLRTALASLAVVSVAVSLAALWAPNVSDRPSPSTD